jgi:GR25 family glycosyltransferase involved in LPS biosynthesis
VFVHPPHFRADAEVALEGRERVVRAYAAWGLTGYVVSLKGARRLLELCATMDRPIDTLVNRHCVSGELKAFACARMLVGCVGQTMQVRREPHQLESLVWNTAPWCERRATSPIPRE